MVNKSVAAVLVALCLCVSVYAFAEQIEVKSAINEVTVYTGDALITRVAGLKLNAGAHTVIFSDIIPEIDENSLRVAGNAGQDVKILGAQVRKEFLQQAPAERVKQLQQEIQNLEDQKRKSEDTKKIIYDEKQFLDSIRLFSQGQIPKDLVTKIPATKDLEDTFNFLGAKLKDNYSQLIETELDIREQDKKIEVLNKELAQVSGPVKKLKRSIVVELEAIKPLNLDLSVSYLVRGASWQPIYDARANFDKSEVELVSYGLIRQNTGEDWQDVNISLSTAKPAIGGRMPYVAPWILQSYQPRKRGWADGSPSMMAGNMAVQKEAFDKEELQAPGAGAPIYSEAEEKGIAIVYKLSRKSDVKSDGSEHKLPISSQELKADFEYSTFPRALPFAFLGSRVTNAKDLQLLAGRVNIFLDGDFVGSSGIDNIGPGEEFDLYLGVDENVKVKREQIEKKVDETLIAGIPSPNKTTTLKYKLTVENYKSRNIKVKLFEAMPVSESDKIKVKIGQVSLEPKEKDWKDRKGIWLWEMELEPKAKKEIVYSFTVEHPRNLQVEGS